MSMLSRRVVRDIRGGGPVLSPRRGQLPFPADQDPGGIRARRFDRCRRPFYAQKLTEVLKVLVIVDNKPGAGQMVAIRSVLAAPPDGYTLYLGTASALSQLPAFATTSPTTR